MTTHFLFKPYAGSRVVDVRLPKDWVLATAATLGDWILAEDACELQWPPSTAAEKAIREMLPVSGGVLYDARDCLRIITPRAALHDVWSLLNTLDPPKTPDLRTWYELGLYQLSVQQDKSFALELTPKSIYVANLPPAPYDADGSVVLDDGSQCKLTLMPPGDGHPGDRAMLVLCDEDGFQRGERLASLRCRRQVHIVFFVHPQSVVAVRDIDVWTICDEWAV